MVAHIRIGDMLVAAGFVTEAQVAQALGRQKESGRRLGAELLEMGFVTEVQFTQVLSNQLSIPWVSLSHVQFTRELLNLLPAALAQAHVVVPIYIRHVRRAGDTLFVAMQDPTDEIALAEVVAATHMPVKPMVAPPTEIQNAIRVYYLGTRGSRGTPAQAVAAAPAPEAPPKATVSQRAAEVAPDEAPAPATPEVEATAPNTEAQAAASAEPPVQEPPAPDSPELEAPASQDEAWSKRAKPQAQRRAQAGPRMITLTLLDGTTVRLPAPGGGGGRSVEQETPASQSLTALDLVRALQARAQGEDVHSVLPDDRWELLFSTLLTLLIKKGLVADWEFVEEWQRQRGD